MSKYTAQVSWSRADNEKYWTINTAGRMSGILMEG